jgi:hypothetical protein
MVTICGALTGKKQAQKSTTTRTIGRTTQEALLIRTLFLIYFIKENFHKKNKFSLYFFLSMKSIFLTSYVSMTSQELNCGPISWKTTIDIVN